MAGSSQRVEVVGVELVKLVVVVVMVVKVVAEAELEVVLVVYRHSTLGVGHRVWDCCPGHAAQPHLLLVPHCLTQLLPWGHFTHESIIMNKPAGS